MRGRFDGELKEMNRELIEMGALCERAIAASAKALEEWDGALALKAVETEIEIDRKEREIEGLCLRLLLTQQPVARDLRQISAALKMITDLERIGDQAADIGEITKQLFPAHGPGDTGKIQSMAHHAVRMVTDSIDAYVRADAELARQVIAADDQVDALFDQVKSDLCRLISSGTEGEWAVDLLMIAKYFERIGDHAANIAEWVEFSITGVHRGEKAL